MDTNNNEELANNSSKPQLTDELINIIEESKAIYFKVKNASDEVQYVNLFRSSNLNHRHVLVYVIGCDTAKQFSYEELMAYLKLGKTKQFDRAVVQSQNLREFVPLFVEFSSNKHKIELREFSYDPYQQQNTLLQCDWSNIEKDGKKGITIDNDFKMSFKMKPDTQLVISFYDTLPPYIKEFNTILKAAPSKQ